MGTGRKRIEIQPIQDMARRRVTLTKRRQGLFKKMDRLRTLTGCEAAAIVFSTAGRPYTYGDLSLLDSFTGSIIRSGSEGGSSASYGHDSGDSHEVLEPEGLDGFTGSIISIGGEGGPSTSYGGGDRAGMIREATDLDGCYGGEHGVGMISEATDLHGCYGGGDGMGMIREATDLDGVGMITEATDLDGCYGGGDGVEIVREATDMEGCYGGGDGVGMNWEATDLDELMVEMKSLLEMRRKVVERLNLHQVEEHVGD